MKYSVSIKVDMGKHISAIGELVDNVNENMSTFGIKEKMSIVSEVSSITIDVEKELTTEEKEKIRDLIKDKFKDVAGTIIGKVVKA